MIHPTTQADRIKSPVALLALILVVALALRLTFFMGLLGWDDVRYWEAAQGLLTGDYGLRSMFWVRYGIIVPLAVSQAIFGQNEYAAALVPLLYSLVSLVLVYALGVLYGGPGVGLTASALLAVFPLDVIAATDVHADLPASVFMAATVYAVKRGEVARNARHRWLMAGGVALGIAYLTKDTALALAVVLAGRLLWLRQNAMCYQWLVLGFAAVVGTEMLCFWGGTGNPFHRYSQAITVPHVAEMVAMQPSHSWMLEYPGMLLNPLNGYFGIHAGIFYLAVAGTLWGLSRRERAIQDLFIWWFAILVLLNFAPLDLSFTRPLFFHFPRTLQAVLIPLVLTAAVWLWHGAPDRRGLKTGLLVGVAAMSAVGMWSLNFDYRLWASVARQAASVIPRYPAETVIVTDHRSMWLLKTLLPDRRDRVAWLSELHGTTAHGTVLVLRDPVFLKGEIEHGYDVPKMLFTPPPNWEKVVEFTRPRRPSLRGLLLERTGIGGGNVEPVPLGATTEPAVLWRVHSLSREGS